jgi:hypothetical protein
LAKSSTALATLSGVIAGIGILSDSKRHHGARLDHFAWHEF